MRTIKTLATIATLALMPVTACTERLPLTSDEAAALTKLITARGFNCPGAGVSLVFLEGADAYGSVTKVWCDTRTPIAYRVTLKKGSITLINPWGE